MMSHETVIPLDVAQLNIPLQVRHRALRADYLQCRNVLAEDLFQGGHLVINRVGTRRALDKKVRKGPTRPRITAEASWDGWIQRVEFKCNCGGEAVVRNDQLLALYVERVRANPTARRIDIFTDEIGP
jgi:hypothetical protein